MGESGRRRRVINGAGGLSDLGRLQTKMEKGDREPERKIEGRRETERETDAERARKGK